MLLLPNDGIVAVLRNMLELLRLIVNFIEGFNHKLSYFLPSLHLLTKLLCEVKSFASSFRVELNIFVLLLCVETTIRVV